MWRLRGERGNAYVEYFLLALIALVAAIAFYDHGNFQGKRTQLESTFDSLANRMAKP